MPLNMETIAWYFIVVMLVFFGIAVIGSLNQSDDEKLRKFIEKRVKEIFNNRMSVVSQGKGKTILWRDHEGRLTIMGWSNHYGVMGAGQYMIFFKRGGNFLKIFPNIFADHICIRATPGDVKKMGDDQLVVKCLGFEPLKSYWFAVTDAMTPDLIKKLVTKDRDTLMADVLEQEMVGIAKTKLDASLLAGLSTPDLGDLESNLMDLGGGSNKDKKTGIDL